MEELNLILVLIFKPLVIVFGILICKRFLQLRELPGMNILLWSMVVFIIGELFCAIDVYIIQRMTFINEGLHDIGMLFSFGGFIWGYFDYTIYRYGCIKTDCIQIQDCDLGPLTCRKFQRVDNNFIVMLLGGGIVLAVLAMAARPITHKILLSAGFGENIIGAYLYNRSQTLYILQQVIFPALAISAFIFTSGKILISRLIDEFTRKLIFFGCGAIGFVYFRLLLINIYHPDVFLTTIGEEILELLFVVLVYRWIKDRKQLIIIGK